MKMDELILNSEIPKKIKTKGTINYNERDRKKIFNTKYR